MALLTIELEVEHEIEGVPAKRVDDLQRTLAEHDIVFTAAARQLVFRLVMDVESLLDGMEQAVDHVTSALDDVDWPRPWQIVRLEAPGWPPPPALSKLEQQVMVEGVSKGRAPEEVAKELGISREEYDRAIDHVMQVLSGPRPPRLQLGDYEHGVFAISYDGPFDGAIRKLRGNPPVGEEIPFQEDHQTSDGGTITKVWSERAVYRYDGRARLTFVRSEKPF